MFSGRGAYGKNPQSGDGSVYCVTEPKRVWVLGRDHVCEFEAGGAFCSIYGKAEG